MRGSFSREIYHMAQLAIRKGNLKTSLFFEALQFQQGSNIISEFNIIVFMPLILCQVLYFVSGRNYTDLVTGGNCMSMLN